MRLNGKVALVTGAANGIGQGIAETFANAGAAVTLAGLNLARAVAKEGAEWGARLRHLPRIRAHAARR